MTDLVDVAQVGQVTFQAGTVVSFFFPDAFSPYYDPNVIKVEPLPLMAGRPVTVSVALENRTKDAAELTATFKATAWNIGGVRWPEIGKVEHIRLKPGEARRVSVNWTPGQAQTSLCFKVEVNVLFDGRAGGRLGGTVVAASVLPAAAWAQQGGAAPQNSTPAQGSVQRNMGPVKSGRQCPLPGSPTGPQPGPLPTPTPVSSGMPAGSYAAGFEDGYFHKPLVPAHYGNNRNEYLRGHFDGLHASPPDTTVDIVTRFAVWVQRAADLVGDAELRTSVPLGCGRG